MWGEPPPSSSGFTLRADLHSDTRGSSLMPRVFWILTLTTRRWQSTHFLTVQDQHLPQCHGSAAGHGEGVTGWPGPQAKVRSRWRRPRLTVPDTMTDGIFRCTVGKTKFQRDQETPPPLVEEHCPDQGPALLTPIPIPFPQHQMPPSSPAALV